MQIQIPVQLQKAMREVSSQAIAITANLGKSKIITTDKVLTEVLNFLSGGGVNLRERAVNTVQQLLNADSEKVTV